MAAKKEKTLPVIEFNREKLEAYSKADMEELADGFADSLIVKMTGLRKSLSMNSMDEAWKYAHEIGGLAALIGVVTLESHANLLETSTEANDFKTSSALVDDLKDIIDATVLELNAYLKTLK